MERIQKQYSFTIDRELKKKTMKMLKSGDPQAESPSEKVRQRSPSRGSAVDEYNAILERCDIEPFSGGRLDGKTVVVKDNIAVEGVPLSCGLSDLSLVPEFHSSMVKKLLRNGASIIGKANMDALAIGPSGEFSERGEVVNPAFEDRVPGGSSSGSAVTVAADLADIAIGSDTGGSVRKPAAFCDIVGMKPTTGIVSRDGFVSLAPSLDTVGPFGPDVESVADAMAVLSEKLLRDQYAEERRFTIGLPRQFLEESDKRIKRRIERLAEIIHADTEHTIRRIELDNHVSETSYPFITSVEFGELVDKKGNISFNYGVNTSVNATVYESVAEQPLNQHISYRMFPNIVYNNANSGKPYDTACLLARKFREKIEQIFDEVDLLLTPTVPVFPPKADDDIKTRPNNQSMNTRPFNISGNPGVAVPAGKVDGLPVSAQVVAPRFEDSLALAGAALIERLVTQHNL